MNLGLVLSLIKIALEVFQDERKDKYLKKYLRIKKGYDNEVSKGINNWSDYKLNELLNEASELTELIIREQSRK